MATSRAPRTIQPAPARRAPEISRGRRALYLAIPFVAFFGLLAGVEALCRHTGPQLTPLEVFVRAPEQKTGFSDYYHFSVFEGDPLLFWRIKPNLRDVIWDFTLFSTNSQGLRYPHEIGPKSPGGFRMVCFGDSVTFGYRVPTVWPDRPQAYDRNWLPFHQILERELAAANPGREVEVIPYAIPGYSSHQGVAWARRDMASLQADVVLVSYGWNDINLRQRTDRETMNTDASQVLLRRLMMKSQALLRASAWWQQRHAAPAPAPGAPRGTTTRVPDAEYVANVQEIVELARKSGAAPIVLGPVYRDPVTEPGEAQRIGALRRRLRETLTAAGQPYLEIPQLTEAAWPANGPLFGERIHPGDLGHRLMARVLLDYMVRHDLLKGLHAPPEPPSSPAVP